MNTYIINLVEKVLVTSFVVFFFVLLHDVDRLSLAGKLIEDLVGFVDLQIITTFQRMYHFLLRSLAHQRLFME